MKFEFPKFRKNNKKNFQMGKELKLTKFCSVKASLTVLRCVQMSEKLCRPKLSVINCVAELKSVSNQSACCSLDQLAQSAWRNIASFSWNCFFFNHKKSQKNGKCDCTFTQFSFSSQFLFNNVYILIGKQK